MHEHDSPDTAPHPSSARCGVEGVTALVAVIASFAWFLSRLSPDIAFGPWQGPLLAPEPLQSLPVLTAGFADAALAVSVGNPAARLNILTALFGALACGTLAAATTRAARAIANPVEAVAAGMASAAVLTTSPQFTYGATGTTPTTLTVFLGLLCLLFLCMWIPEQRPFRYAALAAVAGGLAAANNPAFALLFLLIAAFYMGVPRLGAALAGVFALAVLFVLAASVPLMAALFRGESLRQFLGHALLTPYPNLADTWPRLGFGGALVESLSPLALILALPSLTTLFRIPVRRYVVLALLVLVVMGPLLPFLTNQDTSREVLIDSAAPTLLAAAAVGFLTGLGALIAVRALSPSPRMRPHRLALLLGLTLLVVTLQYHRAPVRQHTVARELGGQILAACPQGSLLVSGDPNLTSLAIASQRVFNTRTDVNIIPAAFLTRPSLRTALDRKLEGRIHLPPDFPADEAIARWATERPDALREMLHSEDRLSQSPQALELAVWDLVLQNPGRWPVCFVGLESPWLAARAEISGPVVTYPRGYDRPDTGFLDLVRDLHDSQPFADDPGVGATLSDLLLPASDLLLRQHAGGDARRVAELVQILGGDRARTGMALYRAAASEGDREEAARYANEYLVAEADTPKEREQVTKTIEEELRSRALREEFQQIVELARKGQPTQKMREEVTRELWRQDDISALVKGYSVLADQDPGDVDALYECAAALTQMGYLSEAQDRLASAALANPSAVGTRLEKDGGRFALLRAYHLYRLSLSPTPRNVS